MKIEYSSPIDEAAAAQVRIFKHSKAASRLVRNTLLGFSTIFLASLIFSYLRNGWDMGRFGFLVLLGVTFLFFYLGTLESRLKKRMRRHLIDQHGNAGAQLVQFELLEDGIVFSGDGTTTKIAWSKFSGLSPNKADIELYWGADCMSILPNAIFESPQQRSEWINFIKEKTGS
jgi:hypothetical protein